MAGSYLTTGSELGRWAWKRQEALNDALYEREAATLKKLSRFLEPIPGAQPGRKRGSKSGGCYTIGLFSVAKHVNYTGEVLCFVGWALLTRRARALLVPLLFAAALRWFYAPNLDRHLKRKYGEGSAFKAWYVPQSLVLCL